ncbi:HvfC/BufC N-terminal domain-containing protein [Acidithiobacillus acidisediminis]|uniref:HvfC/BufC N-terminal domain-containing protein n=2 Tax=Acidithiobacillus TaxID=119977 RepID=UPI00200EC33C|nr:DNA-binding domain-containing protein [Acidithiobacillus sp. S30A2]
MDEIRQWQEAFCHALLADEEGVELPGLVGPISAAASTAIYRNNVLEGFRLALADIYRVVETLVGEECFRALCFDYVRVLPSACGDRNAYGGALPDWLLTHPLVQSVPYLPDLARLEWAQHEAYQAAEGYAENGLHHSLQLVESDYPIFSIWAFCQDPKNAETLDLDRLAGETVLVARPQEEVMMRPMEPTEALWYRSLLSGASPVEAAALVQNREPGIHVRGFLETALIAGLLVEWQ